MVIFYKTWKKCNEIQLTKKQIYLNTSKMKNIKALLELEPNFPGVATPQNREWIICIISYTYNPSTAPWGVRKLLRRYSLWNIEPAITRLFWNERTIYIYKNNWPSICWWFKYKFATIVSSQYALMTHSILRIANYTSYWWLHQDCVITLVIG